MIKTFGLKIGKSAKLPLDGIKATPVNLFVGPGNSGKSTVLNEIKRYCVTGQYSEDDNILNTVEFSGIEGKAAEEKIAELTLPPNTGEAVPVDHVIVGQDLDRVQVALPTLLTVLQNPNTSSDYFCEWFLRFHTLVIDAKKRIELTEPKPVGDLDRPIRSNIQTLFRNNDKRKLVRSIVSQAFGRHLVVDPTNLGYLRYRLSPTVPQNIVEECGIHVQAVQFHKNAALLDEQNDDVRAFVGIITEVIAGNHSILLIDQPEAFMSPEMAFQLGKELVKAAGNVDKKIFIATESIPFILGCMDSKSPVNMIRLTNQYDTPAARLLTNRNVEGFIKNPLLHSLGLLNALTYDCVVVTVSDTSRSFYQEINDRLLKSDANNGIKNCLFINAHDSHTAKTAVQSLRALGVPTASVFDLDVINDGGEIWTNILKSVFIPQTERQLFADMRKKVKASFDSSGKNMLRDGGINILKSENKSLAIKLIEQLAEYGLFVVDIGEMELWLRQLGATGRGSIWLNDIFSKMGDDPDSMSYIKPGKDDVWKFMLSIRKWLIRSNRRGMMA